MRIAYLIVFAVAGFAALISQGQAAGNGAGAGGSGRQRAINSGLPAGDPGPPGSINNPHRAGAPAADRAGLHGTPHPKVGAQTTQ